MVAITVILGAVIGTFVLGLGDQVQQTTPTTNLGFEYSQDGDESTLEVAHDSGDGIEAEELYLAGDIGWNDGTGELNWAVSSEETKSLSGETVRAGDRVTVYGPEHDALDNGLASEENVFVFDGSADDGSDATVRAVWRGEADRSATLRTWEGPDA